MKKYLITDLPVDENAEASNTENSPERPRGVTWLASGVLIIGVMNLVRLVQAITQWQFLSGLPGVSPFYIAASGFLWALVCLPLAWAVWGGRRTAPRWLLIFAAAYTLYFWFDRLAVSSTNLAEDAFSLPFWIGATILILVLTLWILSTRKARAFYRA